MLKEAYDLVKTPLQSEGYHYDEAKEEFYKDWAARSCIWERDDNDRVYDVDCYGVDSSITRNMGTNDQKKQKEIEYLMEAQMERLARPYWKQKQKRLAEGGSVLDWNKYIFDKCYFNWNGGSCSVKNGSDGRSVISFRLKMNQRELLTPQKFLEIATPSIDSNPTPFVKAAGEPELSEEVHIEPGKVVTLGPITGEDGKTKQIQITFVQDSKGKTTVDVQITPRPDLTPGGKEAPIVTPKDTPKDTPAPKDTPDDRDKDKDRDKEKPKDGEDGKDGENGKDGTDGKDGKDGKDGGILCEMFPKILACAEMGDTQDQDFDIPEKAVETTFSPDDFLPSNGICPAPKPFQVLGKTYTLSYEHLCRFAEMIRFLILAIAAVVSARIMFGSQKKE